jgi:hypothetical protein
MKNFAKLLTFLLITGICHSQAPLGDCNSMGSEIREEMGQLDDEYAVNVTQVNKGQICSICSRTKNQIETQESKSFSEHLTSVNGVAITPSKADIAAAKKKLKDKYEVKRNSLKNNLGRMQADCKQELNDYNEQQRKEKEAEQERQRQEYERIAAKAAEDYKQAQIEVRDQIRTSLSDIMERSNINVQNGLSNLKNQEDQLSDVEFEEGFADKNFDYSFDENIMNNKMQEFGSYEDDSFEAEDWSNDQNSFSFRETAREVYDKVGEEWDNVRQIKSDIVDTIKTFASDYIDVIPADGKEYFLNKGLKRIFSNSTAGFISKSFGLGVQAQEAYEMGNDLAEFHEETLDDTFNTADNVIFNDSNIDSSQEIDDLWNRTEERTNNFVCDNLPFCNTVKSLKNRFWGD